MSERARAELLRTRSRSVGGSNKARTKRANSFVLISRDVSQLEPRQSIHCERRTAPQPPQFLRKVSEGGPKEGICEVKWGFVVALTNRRCENIREDKYREDSVRRQAASSSSVCSPWDEQLKRQVQGPTRRKSEDDLVPLPQAPEQAETEGGKAGKGGECKRPPRAASPRPARPITCLNNIFKWVLFVILTHPRPRRARSLARGAATSMSSLAWRG